jgi:ribosomal protein S24E
MNVDIKSKTDNQLLGRKEIEAEVSYSGATPSRTDLKQAVCGKVGVNPDMTVLRDVQTTYGKQLAKVVLHTYEKMEKLMEVEPEHIRKRDKVGETPKEEPKKEEAPKEAPKEEAPKEEPKEAPKEEKKEAPKEEKKEEPKEAPKEEKKEEAPKEEKKE